MQNATVYTNLQTETTVGNIIQTNIWICFFVSFTLGGIAACIAKTISAPFERVKLIQQCLHNQKIEISLLDKEAQDSFLFGVATLLTACVTYQSLLSIWL